MKLEKRTFGTPCIYLFIYLSIISWGKIDREHTLWARGKAATSDGRSKGRKQKWWDLAACHAFLNDSFLFYNNRPFYSCGLSILAFEQTSGWGWPCSDTNLFPFLMEIIFKNSWLAYKNLIYIIKQEGLFQNKVNSSLVFTWNCKMGYWHHFTCFSCKQTSCLLTAVCSEALVLLLPMMASLWNSKKGSSKNMLVSMTRIFVSRIIQQH